MTQRVVICDTDGHAMAGLGTDLTPIVSEQSSIKQRLDALESRFATVESDIDALQNVIAPQPVIEAPIEVGTI